MPICSGRSAPWRPHWPARAGARRRLPAARELQRPAPIPRVNLRTSPHPDPEGSQGTPGPENSGTHAGADSIPLRRPARAKSTRQQSCWARDGSAGPGPAAPRSASPGPAQPALAAFSPVTSQPGWLPPRPAHEIAWDRRSVVPAARPKTACAGGAQDNRASAPLPGTLIPPRRTGARASATGRHAPRPGTAANGCRCRRRRGPA